MTPRNRDEGTTIHEDYEWMNPPQVLVHYVRLRCLELAIRTFDPDSPVNEESLQIVADKLVRYVKTGSMAEPIPKPAAPAASAVDPDKPF